MAIISKDGTPVNATSVGEARPLRVGIVTDGLKETGDGETAHVANGGVGVYISELIAALLRVDGRNEYTLLRCGGGRLPLYGQPRLRAAIVPWTPARRVTRWLDLPYAGLVRRLGLDVVHHPNQVGGLALPASVRQVTTVHDLSALRHPEWHPRARVLRHRLLLRPTLARAAAVVVHAPQTGEELVEEGLVERSRLSVVPLGVAPRFRPGAGRGAAPGIRSPYVLCVGVLEPRKNLEALFEAVRRLHERGTRVGLVVVGREGWRWRDPRRDPRFASLLPYTHVLRDVPDAELAALYCGAAAVACLSHVEGFGLPVLEALASGVPVVASRRVPAADLVPDLALRVPPDEPGQAADALHRALYDAELRGRVAARAPQVGRDFTWERTALATLEVYRRAAAGTSATGTAWPARPMVAQR